MRLARTGLVLRLGIVIMVGCGGRSSMDLIVPSVGVGGTSTSSGGALAGTGGRAGSGGTTSTGGVGTGGRIGTGGVLSTGGMGRGGATGIGGTPGTGGSSARVCRPACSADEACVNGACVLGTVGMTCSRVAECPSNAICCSGDDPACDGSRLPVGNGTNPGQYVVSKDKLTVTDTITGLLWQHDGASERTWEQANAYCAGLVLGGVSGWRLASQMELSTIVDFTRTDSAIDGTAFGGKAGWVWTSSPYAGEDGNAWNVGFNSGLTDYDNEEKLHGVRCVRRAESRCYPTTRFVRLDGGWVRDLVTQLVWQQQASRTTMSWPDAKAYCSSPGFHLPTVKELRSLVDLTVTSGPTINQTAFPSTPTDWFWTSSTYANSSKNSPWQQNDYAWYVSFQTGDSYIDDIGGSNGDNPYHKNRVRCVR